MPFRLTLGAVHEYAGDGPLDQPHQVGSPMAAKLDWPSHIPDHSVDLMKLIQNCEVVYTRREDRQCPLRG